MARPPPPKIGPKPGQVIVVRALYNYTALQEDELSFSEGDLLYVTEDLGVGENCWWKARCGTKSGLIPSNYVELKSERVNNAVHEAARRGNVNFLLDCLTNGVSPTGLDAAGNSPLHWAARTAHVDCLTEIVKAASRTQDSSKFTNAQNKMGETPLHLGARKNSIEVVEALLEAGGNPTLKNKDGEIPFQLATDQTVKKLLYDAAMSEQINGSEDYLENSDEDD